MTTTPAKKTKKEETLLDRRLGYDERKSLQIEMLKAAQAEKPFGLTYKLSTYPDLDATTKFQVGKKAYKVRVVLDAIVADKCVDTSVAYEFRKWRVLKQYRATVRIIDGDRSLDGGAQTKTLKGALDKALRGLAKDFEQYERTQRKEIAEHEKQIAKETERLEAARVIHRDSKKVLAGLQKTPAKKPVKKKAKKK